MSRHAKRLVGRGTCVIGSLALILAGCSDSEPSIYVGDFDTDIRTYVSANIRAISLCNDTAARAEHAWRHNAQGEGSGDDAVAYAEQAQVTCEASIETLQSIEPPPGTPEEQMPMFAGPRTHCLPLYTAALEMTQHIPALVEERASQGEEDAFVSAFHRASADNTPCMDAILDVAIAAELSTEEILAIIADAGAETEQQLNRQD